MRCLMVAREVTEGDEREGGAPCRDQYRASREREPGLSPHFVTRAAPGSSAPAPHNPQIERCSECWSQAINGDKLLAHQLAINQDSECSPRQQLMAVM